MIPLALLYGAGVPLSAFLLARAGVTGTLATTRATRRRVAQPVRRGRAPGRPPTPAPRPGAIIPEPPPITPNGTLIDVVALMGWASKHLMDYQLDKLKEWALPYRAAGRIPTIDETARFFATLLNGEQIDNLEVAFPRFEPFLAKYAPVPPKAGHPPPVDVPAPPPLDETIPLIPPGELERQAAAAQAEHQRQAELQAAVTAEAERKRQAEIAAAEAAAAKVELERQAAAAAAAAATEAERKRQAAAAAQAAELEAERQRQAAAAAQATADTETAARAEAAAAAATAEAQRQRQAEAQAAEAERQRQAEAQAAAAAAAEAERRRQAAAAAAAAATTQAEQATATTRALAERVADDLRAGGNFGYAGNPNPLIVDFQRAAGLADDGIMGPDTRAAGKAVGVTFPLRGVRRAPAPAPAPPPVPAPAAVTPPPPVPAPTAVTPPPTTGPTATQLAQQLAEFFDGSPGRFGYKDHPSEPVRLFQIAAGITPDGIYGPKTREAAAALGVALMVRTKSQATPTSTAQLPEGPQPPVGFDPVKAKNMAPNLTGNLAKRGRAGYSRPLLEQFQVAAGLSKDGKYGPASRGGLIHYGIANPPKAYYGSGTTPYKWAEHAQVYIAQFGSVKPYQQA